MKPAAFDYRVPASLEEALALLAEHGDEARVLAGGQSLMPMLNMRLSRPSVIVDLNRIDELRTTLVGERSLTVGSMIRQREAELDPAFRQRLPVLGDALKRVGHVTTRNRGTIGGSICHADPAAELPALAVFLDATLTVRSQRGVRTIPAAQFYKGVFSTALEPDELLTDVAFPFLERGCGAAVCEFTRRSHEFAIAGVYAALTRNSADVVTSCRLLAFGVNGEISRLTTAENTLMGQIYRTELVDEAAAVARSSLSALSDTVASSAYRLELVRALCARALTTAYERGVPTDE